MADGLYRAVCVVLVPVVSDGYWAEGWISMGWQGYGMPVARNFERA
jgi:hypothetical protein